MKKVKGVYINLDSSEERRKLLESNLRHNKLLEEYSRFDAIRGNQEEASRRGLSVGELGIWHSWTKVLENEIDKNEFDYEYLHIIEDDIIIGDQFSQLINQLHKTPKEMDIIYTDMYVNPSIYKSYKEVFKQAIKDGCIRLSHNTYSGCMASAIISKNKIQYVHNTLKTYLTSNEKLIPLDNAIRSLMHKKKLRIGVTIPFLTTINPKFIQESTIQETYSNKTSVNATQDYCTSLRRFMCVGTESDKTGEIIKSAIKLAQIRNKTTCDQLEYELVEYIVEKVAKYDLPRYKFRANLQGQLNNEQNRATKDVLN